MEPREVLLELFGRVDEHVEAVVDGLDAGALIERAEPGTNTIGWLIWHLTRVADHHLSEITANEQAWSAGNWAPRFGLAPDAEDIGFGHTPEQVVEVRPDGPEVLVDYHGAVAVRLRDYLAGVSAADLDEIVDRRWDPPVTLGVRLVSVADDQIQHAGQAAYLRGLLERRGVLPGP